MSPRGVLDFSGTGALIDQARRRGGHHVLLWFGSWKTGRCMYVPEWVRRDIGRFWQADPIKGQRKLVLTNFHDLEYSTMSAFCDAPREADTRALAAPMAHERAYARL